MTLIELDTYFNSFLKKENFLPDPSLNGIQIQNSAPNSKQIRKIAFAVDACEETAILAAKANADLLFVHHGIFWGNCEKLIASQYKRVSAFIKNDLALCAYHIPLDANNPYGNNYGLARRLELEDCEPFGNWRGMMVGVKGILPKPLTLEQISEKILQSCEKPNVILAFGDRPLCQKIGIISGSASEDVKKAVDSGLDVFITGEFCHEQYHYAKEMKINVIGCGHYQTETVGVNLVRQKVEKELGVETIFIDLPTGL